MIKALGAQVETRLHFTIEQLKAQIKAKDAEIAKQNTVITNLKRRVAELSAKPIKKVKKEKHV